MLDIKKEQIKEIEKKFGNAFYILDSNQFRDNYCVLTESFKKRYNNFVIAYSYKTNYIPRICKIVNELGGYAEVVSEMEMELALMVGVPYERIIWNGPVKNRSVAEDFLLKGGNINLDTVVEADYACQLAERMPDRQLSIGIRCNFDVRDGVLSRFGIDVETEEFKCVLKKIKATANLRVNYVQCHFAKRELEFWKNRTQRMIHVYKLITEVLGYYPHTIDLGGGMFGEMEPTLKAQFDKVIPKYEDYAKTVTEILMKEFPEKNVRIMIEPGTALVGNCMYYMGQVESIKNIRGKKFATILGSQKNINMGVLNPPINVIHMNDLKEYYDDIDLVGYTCIESDILFRNYCGDISVGDYVVFANCGSYSIVMKPPFILPNFAVVDLSNGIEVIKRKETFDDIFSSYML